MSDRQVRDEAMTIFLAGHETTANALSWMWFLLSGAPDVEQALHEELDRVLADRLPTLADLPHLPFVEQVVTETMRLYPPAWGFGRSGFQADTFGNYQVPAKSLVLISPYIMHRHPAFCHDPETFAPERFAPEEEAARPKFAYLPFGAGQRACIGQAFAMLEAQLVLATWLPKLHFVYAAKHPPRISTGVTLSPRGGMPMHVSHR